MMMLLFYTFLVTPYKLSFIDEDIQWWKIFDSVVDIFFLVDIILNFFMAFYDTRHVLVDKHTKIATGYLSSWFIIDSLSIFPADLLFGGSDFTEVARITKIGKLYRLVKMFKLLRLMKVT